MNLRGTTVLNARVRVLIVIACLLIGISSCSKNKAEHVVTGFVGA